MLLKNYRGLKIPIEAAVKIMFDKRRAPKKIIFISVVHSESLFISNLELILKTDKCLT